MPFAGQLHSKMQSMAGMGRGADTTMAHLTPGEVVVPLSITRMYPGLVRAISDAISRRGRNPRDFIVGAPGGNVNAMTGMEEFLEGGTGGVSDTIGGGQTDPADASIGVSLGDIPGPPGMETPGPADPSMSLDPTATAGPPSGVDSMSAEQQSIDRGFSRPDQRQGDTPDRTPDTIGGYMGGPRGMRNDPNAAAVAGRQGFFGALGEAFSNPSNPGLAKGLTVAGAFPGIGTLASLGRAGMIARDTFNNLGKPSYDNPIGGTPAAEAPSPSMGGPVGGPNDNGTGGDNIQRFPGGSGQPVGAPFGPSNPNFPSDPITTMPPTGLLPPQEAARIAEELGVSNDAFQARAQIATYALNSDDWNFRSPEAAALWETLLAQSYSPNPGLLDIERQYMAQVLGYGDRAYEGEDETARQLAATGAPIRRAQVAV